MRPRRRTVIALLTAALTVVGLTVVTAPASAATGDIGYQDQSYAGATYPATSDKPQSKLWYTGGYWFADMFDTVSKTWHIFRLDRPTEKWIDTGVLIDSRVNTLGDALWDGTHLYVASHVVAVSTDVSAVPSTTGNPAYLYRYSYNAANATFTLDSGFPTTITDSSSESMTIDEDSTGTIWATWTQVSGDATSGYTNQVYLNTATANGATWDTPFTMPIAGGNPNQDDISAVVAYGGNQVGVLWSNQNAQAMYFASHTDGDPRTSFTGGAIPGLVGNHSADDHMNIKSIQGDSSGRIFAAVKTSADENANRTTADPLLVLLEFSPGSGWSKSTIATLGDCNTRPQVMLDTQHSILHVFSSAPTGTSCASTNAQTIYDKTASFTNPVFASGRGTPVIQSAADTSTSTEYMNNVTTSKQSVNGDTGLVVLAGDTATKTYWHADLNLGGASGDVTPPSTPGSFTATASSNTQVDLAWTASADDVGVVAYRVYRDGSTTPLAQVDGSTLAYSDTTVTAGITYAYQVSAVDAAGNESVKANASVTTPGGAQALSFGPVADATVQSANPSTNYGTTTRLAADGSPLTSALLKFTVTGTSGCSVSQAVLRLTVGSSTSDNSVYGGDLNAVADNTWTETGVTWSTKPASGAKLGSISGAVALSTPYTIDVTPYITGDGTYSMILSSTNADAAAYYSKEASSTSVRPQLNVTCGPAVTDTTPPSTPGSLTATATNATQVDLAWTASTDDVRVTGYNVYRNGSTTPLAQLTGSALAYTDTTVSAGTAYTYQVSAVDAAGNESVKASASVTTPTGTTTTFAPVADATVQSANPSTNYGASTRLTADGSPLTSALLKFTVTGTSSCAVSKAVLKLTVGSSTSDGSVYGGDLNAVADNTWTETGVTWGTKPASGVKLGSISGAVALSTPYTIDVTPYITGDGTYSMALSSTNADAAAYYSKEASSTSVRPQLQVTCGPDTTAPSVPGSFTATAPRASQVNLSWKASTDNLGVTGYNVYRNGSTTPLATTASTATGYTDSTVTASTAYTYQVSAIDAAGNESAKASASVTTPSSTVVQSFIASADATLESAHPTHNYGSGQRLTAVSTPATAAIMRFGVTGTSGCTVTKAVLTLTVGASNGNSSVYGADVYPVASTTWTENGVTWNTRPAVGTKVGTISGAPVNTARTLDVTSLVTGDGALSMMLQSPNADDVSYFSSEVSTASQRPTLTVTATCS